MVSVGVPALGRTAIHFAEPGVKVNGQYYRDIIQGLLPGILTFSDYYTLQEDGASAHRARETVELLGNETPDFIPSTLWPPNSPDLNPVDYTIWSVMWESVHRAKVRDIKDLRQRIMQAWDDLIRIQGSIDALVKQRLTRLHACVTANGRQFEHKL